MSGPRPVGAHPVGSEGACRSADSGSATVEFAVVLPVFVVAVGLAVGAVAAAGVQVRLQVGVAAVARALGRDDADAAAEAEHALLPSARTTVVHTGGTVCVRAVRPVRVGVLPNVDVAAVGCALESGR